MRCAVLVVWLIVLAGNSIAQDADLILTGGQIVTVNPGFEIVEAMAVRGDRILAVGANDDIRKLAGAKTQAIDLAGKMVLPGLIDSHVHATGAAVYEFDHPIPEMETLDDVLKYVAHRADVLDDGQWIVLNQVFITRLRDQRFPTRYELDQVAPKNPVYFRTGPDAALNSLALQLNGIDKDFRITDGQPGRIETDPQTGEPTGIIRSAGRFITMKSPEKSPSFDEQKSQLRKLLADYNAVGITSIVQRSADESSFRLFDSLKQDDALTCRTFLCWGVNPTGEWETVAAQIEQAASHPAHAYNNMLWVRGVKVFLDGGMLTGSAWMRKPWGVSSIYSITDPEYRGVLLIEPERLYQIARLCLENDLQITAHSVGDGAVHALLEAYRRVSENDFPVRDKRPCITHCNFMSAEAIQSMKELGVVADIQPVWLYLDGKTLLRQFGEERTRWFQPYKTIFEQGVMVGGGSDHMQKIGSFRSVNPYNPFLGIWTTLVRQPRWTDVPLHPEEKITREQAIRFYTINNAWLTFEEKEKGSLEPGKLADFIVIDSNLLTCDVDAIRETTVEQTWLGGRRVYERSR
ncbi:MAG: amidohydrolase [Planctomycetaceae bacterium]|nr:amidohydrolase [Planctomycetaceae bacterium]